MLSFLFVFGQRIEKIGLGGGVEFVFEPETGAYDRPVIIHILSAETT